MNIVERVGGIGVAIMAYKTTYEVETDVAVELSRKLCDLADQRQAATKRLQQMVQRRQQQLKKFSSGCNDLRKSATSSSFDDLSRDLNKSLTDFAELSELSTTISKHISSIGSIQGEMIATQAELKKALDRRDAALPEFRMWMLAQHCGPTPAPRSFGVADKSTDAKRDCALAPLSKPTTAVDLSSAVSDATLRHRPDLGRRF
ncbi:hypothetical protein [Bradyrhizobium japonicum]|uniref:hypothetical protein n=1 Tax=Bradyrhizobium japonicum TaxID=375 RepID=UPI001BA47E5C|nr:hypothetical protein [Bradyrhizobium japonicum]MBR0760718.1 hypothetical protein [Bradyrhizobium japonicum]